MKVQIVGHIIKEGVSNKTGTPKPYAIGELHILVPFSARDQGSSGYCGGKHSVEPMILKKVAHLPLPFEAELFVQDVMLYGKQQQEVIDIVPTQMLKKAA
jgi:CTX phage RstB protein